MFIKLMHWISDKFLDNPFMFNFVRYLLAGKQTGMKKFVSKYLKKYHCEIIADFCCGTGDFADPCPKNSKYYGFDINSSFIVYASKKYERDKTKKFLKADVLYSKEIYTKKYDVILLISAMHHLSDNQLDLLLPKVKRITKKILIVADIIPDPPHFLQKFFAAIDRGRYIRPKEEKINILKKYFRIVSTEFILTRSAIQFGIICESKL